MNAIFLEQKALPFFFLFPLFGSVISLPHQLKYNCRAAVAREELAPQKYTLQMGPFRETGSVEENTGPKKNSIKRNVGAGVRLGRQRWKEEKDLFERKRIRIAYRMDSNYCFKISLFQMLRQNYAMFHSWYIMAVENPILNVL